MIHDHVQFRVNCYYTLKTLRCADVLQPSSTKKYARVLPGVLVLKLGGLVALLALNGATSSRIRLFLAFCLERNIRDGVLAHILVPAATSAPC